MFPTVFRIVGLSFLISLIWMPTTAQFQRCGTDEWALEYEAQYAIARIHKATVEAKIQQWINERSISSRNVITIPVVVHVVWNEAEENISDAQIESQIETLNQDFRALNVEVASVDEEFRAFVADVELEFCLAKIDPRGRATNGITRTFTNLIGIANNQNLIKYGTRGGADDWDTDRYVNIWVGRRTDGILGISTRPGDFNEVQGLVIDYRAFGRGGSAEQNHPYNLGRTTTHEMGHYLGLKHLWGEGLDNDNCSEDDGILDTPKQSDTYNSQCPSSPKSSCRSSDMYMNFMNYTDDACMSLFTLGQKERMLATLFAVRPRLVNTMVCENITTTNAQQAMELKLYPNPAQDQFSISTEMPIQSIHIINSLGQTCHHLMSPKNTVVGVAHLPSGHYQVVITTQHRTIVRPLLIQ